MASKRRLMLRRRKFKSPGVDPDLALLYKFAEDKSLVARDGFGPTLDITRTTDGTFFGSDGLLQTASSGVARFNHNPTTPFASLGLMVEAARTNILVRSEEFQTTWAVVGSATLETNKATAPDGNLTADELVDDSSTGTGSIALSQTFTVETSTAYTLSVFCKKNGLDFVALRTQAWTTPGNVESFFDLSSGVVGTAGTGHTLAIKDVGDGWHRCSITMTSDSVDTAAGIRIYLSDGDGDITVDLDGTSSIFVYGAVLEKGSEPTSYIKTEASTVTRDADVESTATVSDINANVGTWYVSGSFQHASAAARKILTLDDGGTTDRMFLELDASENINFATTHSADDDGASDGAAVIAVNTAFEVSAAYADDDVIAYVDGTSSGADSSAAFPLADAMTTLRIGADSAGNYFNGHIKELRYYNVRKANQFLEDLSNGLIIA